MIFVKIKIINLINKFLKKIDAQIIKRSFFEKLYNQSGEFEILKNFDFNNFKFRVITCEHNFSDNREKIYKLLTDNGYIRKFVKISKFEDWYILEKKLASNA